MEQSGARALRLFWQPPPKSEHNGPLLSYRIRWQAVTDGSSDLGLLPGESSEFPFSAKPTSSAVDGYDTVMANKPLRYKITNLLTWTTYRVTVAAGTQKGFGPESPAVEERTMEDGTYRNGFASRNNGRRQSRVAQCRPQCC